MFSFNVSEYAYHDDYRVRLQLSSTGESCLFLRIVRPKQDMRESVFGCCRGLQLKKTGLMLVAYKSRPEETKAMRDAFKAYDIDQNGLVSREEFINVLRSQGYTDEEVRGELEYREALLVFFRDWVVLVDVSV